MPAARVPEAARGCHTRSRNRHARPSAGCGGAGDSLRTGSSLSSALGKNRPFALTKSDPHREQDLPVGKTEHHPRRRRAVCRCVIRAGRTLEGCQPTGVHRTACGPKRSSHRGIATWQAARCRPTRAQIWYQDVPVERGHFWRAKYGYFSRAPEAAHFAHETGEPAKDRAGAARTGTITLKLRAVWIGSRFRAIP